MADDIIIKFRADDQNLIQTLKQLKTLQEQTTTRARKATAQFKKLNTELKKTTIGNKGVGDGFADITNKGRLLNNSLATMRSKLLLVSFGMGLVSAAVAKNIASFGKQEESVARLGLQFGSSGAQALDTYSSSLQQVTRFGDEHINSMMSQFGAYGANIEQTKQLATATLDLAEGQGMDLNSAALLVAKSFGSSTNALSRYGIMIDASASKEQKIQQILAQSQSKYGGLAKLLGQMSASELVKFQNGMGDLQESLGETLSTGLNPIIKTFTKWNKQLEGAPIRKFVEFVISATTALALWQAGVVVLRTKTAIATAFATAHAAALKATGTAAIGAAGSLKVFGKALVTSTGGIGAIILAIGTAGVALMEWMGWFEATEEETEGANKALDKYKGSIKKMDLDNGVTQLTKFHDKLKEGNALLRFTAASFDKDFIGALNELTLPPIVKELSQDTLDLAATYNEAADKLDKADQATLGYTDDVDAAISAQQRYKEVLLDTSHILNNTKYKDAAEALDEYNAAVERNAPANEKFKQDFIDATGFSSDFFDGFIKDSGIFEAVQAGVITNNGELLAVLEDNVELQGALASGDETEVQLIIEKIVQKERLIATIKKEMEANRGVIALDKMTGKQKWQLAKDTVSAAGAVFAANKKTAIVAARIQQGMAIVNTIEAVTKALNNPVEMIRLSLLGAAQVMKIQEQIDNMKAQNAQTGLQAELGGYIGGKRHFQGGTMIEAERGEFILRRDAVDSIGLETLNEMNETGSTGGVVVNVTGNVMTQDFVEGELAESIKEAVRRGGNFGMS